MIKDVSTSMELLNSADMFSLVQSPDSLLTMPVEKQAVFVLKLLAKFDTNESPISRENFFLRKGDARRLPKYGNRQQVVDVELRKTWSWLESREYLADSTVVGPNWFFVSIAGRNFITESAEAEQFTRLSELLSVKVLETNSLPLIAGTRLAELRELKSPDFDFRRLIRQCEELNMAYRDGCYFATAMLTRSLLDHVPPLFEKTKFEEVANNYGGRSFKGTMQHLQEVSRNVADGHLHQQIRKSETLPMAQQVNCTQQLDALLEEIIRITRKDK